MFDKLAEDIEKRYWQKLAWMANKHNYTHGTSAKFSPASRPDKEPDYVSKSDSEYWISPMGVTRGSDHWGTVGSCDWKLGKNKFPKKKIYGFSPWENFEKKAGSIFDAMDKPGIIPPDIPFHPTDYNGLLEFIPYDDYEPEKPVDFNKILQVGNRKSKLTNLVKNIKEDNLALNNYKGKPVKVPETVTLNKDLRRVLDKLLGKKIMGFRKTASALSDVDVSNWDNLSTDERKLKIYDFMERKVKED